MRAHVHTLPTHIIGMPSARHVTRSSHSAATHLHAWRRHSCASATPAPGVCTVAARSQRAPCIEGALRAPCIEGAPAPKCGPRFNSMPHNNRQIQRPCTARERNSQQVSTSSRGAPLVLLPQHSRRSTRAASYNSTLRQPVCPDAIGSPGVQLVLLLQHSRRQLLGAVGGVHRHYRLCQDGACNQQGVA